MFTLVRNWWAFALRGLVAVLFGILCLARPGISLAVLVTLFGVYALIDGIAEIAGAANAGKSGQRWGWLLFAGLCSIAAGVLAFVWPGITALALLFTIAAWAIVTGVLQIIAAVQLRHEIKNEWLLGLAGALSIVFGVLIAARPGSGALAVLWLIGVFAIAFGIANIALGFRLRSLGAGEHFGHGEVPA